MLGVTLIYETRNTRKGGGGARGTDLPNNLPKKEQLFSGSQQIGAHGLPLHQGLGETIIRGADTIDVTRVSLLL